MDRKKPYCLRYWGPDLDDRKDRGKFSFEYEDVALAEARRAVASRETRCPASHVTVTDENKGDVLFTWHGPEAAR